MKKYFDLIDQSDTNPVSPCRGTRGMGVYSGQGLFILTNPPRRSIYKKTAERVKPVGWKE